MTGARCRSRFGHCVTEPIHLPADDQSRLAAGLTFAEVCAGVGGLGRAIEQVTGATPIWFSEFDEAPAKVLAHHYPDVPNYGDLTVIEWHAMPRPDILTGGYPCQPFSQAGKRLGEADPRHLWPHIAEAMSVMRPMFGMFENVYGHLSKGFDVVLDDMASIGYQVHWGILAASSVGAPHERKRLFILAEDVYGRKVPTPSGVGVPIDQVKKFPKAGHMLHGLVYTAPDLNSPMDKLKALPTPTASMTTGAGTGGREGGLNLQTAVDRLPLKLLPTPTTQDAANNGGPSQFRRNTLPLNARVLALEAA